mmetsp:Transcript_1092/g.3624  ORF Transcript_1092/g.3624 Transcript_1092/m.3624 type:complete len:228 (-) Transcript_1092:402-1085(-)
MRWAPPPAMPSLGRNRMPRCHLVQLLQRRRSKALTLEPGHPRFTPELAPRRLGPRAPVSLRVRRPVPGHRPPGANHNSPLGHHQRQQPQDSPAFQGQAEGAQRQPAPRPPRPGIEERRSERVRAHAGDGEGRHPRLPHHPAAMHRHRKCGRFRNRRQNGREENIGRYRRHRLLELAPRPAMDDHLRGPVPPAVRRRRRCRRQRAPARPCHPRARLSPQHIRLRPYLR